MKRVGIDQIVGIEKIVKDICLSNGTILLPAGAVIKKEYIRYLQNLNIHDVYIEDPVDVQMDNVIEEIIQEECKEIVKTTIEKYSYCGNVELQDITEAADNILNEMIRKPEVMYNISQVREKSESTYAHSINVAALSVFIGLRMKLKEERIKDIAIGALLHDLGILYLPFDYRNINYNSCDESLKKEIKKHVITGYSSVDKEKWLSSISKEIILSHHEREDGTGYPMRLTKEKIPFETKLVSLCDEFDSLVYGYFTNKLKVHDAIDYIISQAGVKFDHKIVRKFVESVAAYPVGTYVITNENEIGVVLRQNKKLPTRPVIRMIEDANGEYYTTIVEKDLTKELTLFIRDTLNE
ncbi:HD-GYP domain-containing protein [Clostridium sp. Marseille-P299]|uniref:HD-GYP domain-containing protein n=1 Tax=Clostridium sp. Marseille-P299 TaxID=1805477 RepID=UPI0008352374|nr:HD domain-containing phosphohydrolase [Clostridium sp. Marseille-P299]